MSSEHDPVTHLLSGLEPVDPPPALRGRALARAEQAWAEAAAPDRWRQIWESRPLRLAWATAAVALVVANLAVPAAPGGSPAVAAHNGSTTTSRELQDAVSLPRLRSSYVGVDVAAASPEAAPEQPTNPAAKETRT